METIDDDKTRVHLFHTRAELCSHARSLAKQRDVVLITDENVSKLYGSEIARALQLSAHRFESMALEPGEGAKCSTNKARLDQRLVESGHGRDTIIFVLGGGVPGDLGGFVAATYNRGIAWTFIPTTLLAQVDASIGGKTGINVGAAKNAIGAFHDPTQVLISVDYLETLGESDYKSGLGEIVKYGMIYDKELFAYLENATTQILERDKTTLLRVVRRCIEIKLKVVRGDRFDGAQRNILNYGHTVGHAIETSTGLPHGVAVALGMRVEGLLSNRLAGLGVADLDRQNALLDALGLRVERSVQLIDEKIVDLVKTTDKKRRWDAAGEYKIRLSLPTRLGDVAPTEGGEWTRPASVDELREALKVLGE